ncbi:unnamed protein product [Lactuca saligna]|uniref:Uncharacterized protein n=1 Tax=Lactuca saligna TaxID=75948 RepID=A0AA36DW52_LACSI|nr:unnamed protein product [Lactuca saligna]
MCLNLALIVDYMLSMSDLPSSFISAALGSHRSPHRSCYSFGTSITPQKLRFYPFLLPFPFIAYIFHSPPINLIQSHAPLPRQNLANLRVLFQFLRLRLCNTASDVGAHFAWREGVGSSTASADLWVS